MKKGLVLLSCLSFLPVFLFTPTVYADDQQVLRVGIYENRPKIFTDGNGNASGFWPDITQAIVSGMGWRIEYVHGTWEECLNKLEENEIDVMPDVAYSEERSTRYDFASEPVYVSWSLVYARKGTDIQSVVDLKGKKVAVLRGSVNVDDPEGIKKLVDAFHVDCTFIEADSYQQVFEMVDSGDVDAGVTSKDFGHINEEDFLVDRTPIIFAPSSLYFAFSKSSSLTPYLIDRFDTYMKQLKGKQDSVYYRSMEYWMGIKPEGRPVIPAWVFWIFTGILGIAFVFAVMSFTQRSKVKIRTKELAVEISERKKYEEIDKSKSGYLSMALQKLRIPLSIIKNNSAMLIADKGKMNEEERIVSLKSIDKAADQLMFIVDQWKDISPVDAGLLKIEKELSDPVKLILQAMNDARLKYPKYLIVSDVEKPNLPMVHLDAKQIHQVMDILIDSAVKNSQDIKKVELSAAFLDENIFISVTSYGTGIIEYDIKQIFERKYRVEQEIPNSDADTGLFTAKSIVEAHGGRIWAENQPEQGSRIIFTIPLSE